MNFYLNRFGAGPELIKETPSSLLTQVVVIPAYKEADLLYSLESLRNCQLPKNDSEVIVIINFPENASDEEINFHRDLYNSAVNWSKDNSTDKLKFFISLQILPSKHAGVGLARKIGMDEAVRRLDKAGIGGDGIIICFDADSQCSSDYLVEIENNFMEFNPDGASIFFEHPLEGNYPDEIYTAITSYELFLRYYVNSLKWAGHPFAFQTIGSSMAVKSSVYQEQGGMNKKKAGEDFYFLQKIIPLGNFLELNSTTVIPSPRFSDRVPFGTGKAVGDFLKNKKLELYDFKIFHDLKNFLLVSDLLFDHNEVILPSAIESFLLKNDFYKNIEEIKTNSRDLISFRKRFFRWFNGFQVLKFVHFATENFYPKNDIKIALDELSEHLNLPFSTELKTILLNLRKYDRENRNLIIRENPFKHGFSRK